LTCHLAGGAALRFSAELLAPPMADAGIEQLFAMQTLALIRFGHHAMVNNR
jgi:hypothetical protein